MIPCFLSVTFIFVGVVNVSLLQLQLFSSTLLVLSDQSGLARELHKHIRDLKHLGVDKNHHEPK